MNGYYVSGQDTLKAKESKKRKKKSQAPQMTGDGECDNEPGGSRWEPWKCDFMTPTAHIDETRNVVGNGRTLRRRNSDASSGRWFITKFLPDRLSVQPHHLLHALLYFPWEKEESKLVGILLEQRCKRSKFACICSPIHSFTHSSPMSDQVCATGQAWWQQTETGPG